MYASFFLALFSCQSQAKVLLDVPAFYPSELISSSSGGIKYFSFTQDQKGAIANFFESNGDAALLISMQSLKLKVSPQENAPLISFGFFYTNSEKSSEVQSLPVVTDNLQKYQGSPFSLAFCFSKERGLPQGFFIKTASNVKIVSSQITRAFVGHDFSGEIPVFAFAPNGGVNNGRDDFRGASLVFSSTNDRENLMPTILLKLSESAKSQKIAFGGEVLTVRSSEVPCEIPAASLKSPFSDVAYPDCDTLPEILVMRASDKKALSFAQGKKNVLVPIKCDPGLVIKWPRNNWRGNDYEFFEWDRFPGVFLFDISTYSVQDDFFRRIAYFVEKSGFKGRLLSDSELEGRHGYNAHDYKADDLARFFEKARNENFPLNEKELLLKQILVDNAVLVSDSDGSVKPGRGAVISICQESSSDLRTSLLAHEGWHGIYFSDENFRNTVASVYYTIDSRTLDYLIRYFRITPSLNYDVNDEYLLKNEFMAYLLQQGLRYTSTYFVNKAKREHSQQLAKEEADYVIQTNGSGFASAARLLDEYVNDRWGLNAGRVWMISR